MKLHLLLFYISLIIIPSTLLCYISKTNTLLKSNYNYRVKVILKSQLNDSNNDKENKENKSFIFTKASILASILLSFTASQTQAITNNNNNNLQSSSNIIISKIQFKDKQIYIDNDFSDLPSLPTIQSNLKNNAIQISNQIGTTIIPTLDHSITDITKNYLHIDKPLTLPTLPTLPKIDLGINIEYRDKQFYVTVDPTKVTLPPILSDLTNLKADSVVFPPLATKENRLLTTTIRTEPTTTTASTTSTATTTNSNLKLVDSYNALITYLSSIRIDPESITSLTQNLNDWRVLLPLLVLTVFTAEAKQSEAQLKGILEEQSDELLSVQERVALEKKRAEDLQKIIEEREAKALEEMKNAEEAAAAAKALEEKKRAEEAAAAAKALEENKRAEEAAAAAKALEENKRAEEAAAAAKALEEKKRAEEAAAAAKALEEKKAEEAAAVAKALEEKRKAEWTEAITTKPPSKSKSTTKASTAAEPKAPRKKKAPSPIAPSLITLSVPAPDLANTTPIPPPAPSTPTPTLPPDASLSADLRDLIEQADAILRVEEEAARFAEEKAYENTDLNTPKNSKQSTTTPTTTTSTTKKTTKATKPPTTLPTTAPETAPVTDATLAKEKTARKPKNNKPI